MLGFRQTDEAPFRSLRAVVRMGPGGLVPVLFFAAFFAAFAKYTGIPVGAAALLGAVGGMVSLFVHELGHVRAARKISGIRSAKVSLFWAGATTRFEGKYATGREQMQVAIAGPRASFAFGGGLFLMCAFPISHFRGMVFALALFNVLIGLLNLLPTYPLDGHKLAVGMLWSATGSEGQAKRIIRRIGVCWAALELPSAVALLFARPQVGIVALVLVGSVMAQKRFVRKPAV
jgi:Zn-dependent protease